MVQTGDFNIKQFRPSSMDYKVAKLLLEGKTREETIKELFPLVGKREPFIYRENIGGGRRKKPMEDQYRLFIYNVNRTIGKMRDQGFDLEESFSERTKWGSKERHWVDWRRKYIRDLLDQGLAGEPPDPNIPKPGDVTPVDPQGNPIKSKSKVRADISNPDYTQDDLAQMSELLELEDKITWFGNEAVEFNDENEEVAEWKKGDDGNITRTKTGEYKGKFEDKFDALVEERATPEPEPIVIKAPTRPELIDNFYKRMMLARDFVISRELGGEYLDFVSTRAIKDGAKAIAFGIHPDEVMQAVTKTWSEDSKREFERHERPWKPKAPLIDIKKYPVPVEGGHMYLGYVKILAEARIPILLVGPSGSGKSFMARDLAEYVMECNYGELPLTAGATPSWLVGAETISGYKSRPFVDIYENGGVFCFEEMDAADPNMLLIVNNAIANNFFTNPVTGREIEKSKNFIPIATANTWGLGANRQYTGRERLDAATLDRWRVGRVEVDYDATIEKMIITDMKEIAGKRERKTKPKKAVA